MLCHWCRRCNATFGLVSEVDTKLVSFELANEELIVKTSGRWGAIEFALTDIEKKGDRGAHWIYEIGLPFPAWFL